MGRSKARAVAIAGVCAAIAVAASPTVAFADEAAPCLLERAMVELETQSYGEACPLFLKSYEVDHAPTTLVLAAECLEKAGRLASAHATYTRVLELPAGALPDAARSHARARHAELGPRLSRVTVRLPPEVRVLAGLRVSIDRQELARDTWDGPHVRDAGPVAVEVTTPSRAVFATTLSLPSEGADVVVDLPGLAGLESQNVTRVFVGPRGTPRRARYAVDEATLGPYQLAGAGLFAAGAAALGTGVVLGVLAKADHNRAATLCTGTVCADRALVEAGDSARTKGDAGTVVGVLGAVLMAGGAGVYFFAPNPMKTQYFSISSRGLGVVAQGTFQ